MAIKKRKTLVFFIILIILVTVFSLFFFKKGKENYSLFKVLKTEIVQEVAETGTVKMGEELKLGFKTAGRIEDIFVETGKEIREGEILVQLDKSQLIFQLKEAEANLEAQKAKLDELKKGTRPQEIEISKNLLEKAEKDLENLYIETVTILNQAYNLSDGAIRQEIAPLFLYRSDANIPYYELTFKYCDEKIAKEAALKRNDSEEELKYWKKELEEMSVQKEVIEGMILKSETHLGILKDFLKKLNDALIITPNCVLTYQEITKINSYKFYVNSAITSLNNAVNLILAQKKLIEGQKIVVKNYQQELSLKMAGPTQEQIGYQEALVKQGEARIKFLQEQIQECVLKTPISGQIVKINKKVGEIVQIAEPVITILPAKPFQLEVDIYEEDIVKIKLGNEVKIKLTAFPSENLKGKVVFIDPETRIKEGIVYYKVTIDFEKIPEGIRPGMTADVSIKTFSKENALAVPKSALEEKNNKKIVRILKGKNIEEREIETGIEGSNDLIEIVSGLKEGEEIILK